MSPPNTLNVETAIQALGSLEAAYRGNRLLLWGCVGTGLAFLASGGFFLFGPPASLLLGLASGICGLGFLVGAALVAAMNPCPCGFFGTQKCSCRKADVRRYQKRVSGPILGRIDLQLEMGRLTARERFAEPHADISQRIRARVEAARQMQNRRFAGTDDPFNAAVPAGRVRELCDFSPEGFERYRGGVTASTLSTRSADRLAKMSRTVVDPTG
jgi:predicted ATPase with chaperone activity